MDLLIAYLIFIAAQYLFYLGTETPEELQKRIGDEADLDIIYLGLLLNCFLGLALLAPLDPYYWEK